MASNKNKKYYKKNYYYKNNKNKNNEVSKKGSYESLMTAKVIIKESQDNFDSLLIMKYIAISVVIFAIIIGSFILFRSN